MSLSRGTDFESTGTYDIFLTYKCDGCTQEIKVKSAKEVSLAKWSEILVMKNTDKSAELKHGCFNCMATGLLHIFIREMGYQLLYIGTVKIERCIE